MNRVCSRSLGKNPQKTRQNYHYFKATEGDAGKSSGWSCKEMPACDPLLLELHGKAIIFIASKVVPYFVRSVSCIVLRNASQRSWHGRIAKRARSRLPRTAQPWGSLPCEDMANGNKLIRDSDQLRSTRSQLSCGMRVVLSKDQQKYGGNLLRTTFRLVRNVFYECLWHNFLVQVKAVLTQV